MSFQETEYGVLKFPEHKLDRGLIKGRSYKNTVYIVECTNNERYYVLLVDTPLKTFYETCQEHNRFEDNKKEIISSFYYTLKELIDNNPEMRDGVKLIYYDDEKKDLKIPDIVEERILLRKPKKENN